MEVPPMDAEETATKGITRGNSPVWLYEGGENIISYETQIT
jgi:hypothetical protein